MNCYLVVGNVSSPTVADQSLAGRLVALGYTVSYRDDSASRPSGVDLAVLSSSCSGSTLGNKYKTYLGPVVSFAHTAHDSMDWSQDVISNNQTQIDVVNDSHPIAVDAGLSLGLTTVYDSAHLLWSDDRVPEETTATVIANHPTTGDANFYAFDTGDLDTDSRPMENRRVAVPLYFGSVDPPINATGGAIVDASVIWADNLTVPLQGASSSASALAGRLAEPLAGASSSASALAGALVGGVAPTGPPPAPMQVVTVADRVALIEADRVDVDLRIDVLDGTNRLVGTVDADNAIIRHDTNTNVHRSVELITADELDWPVQRVRPVVTVTSRLWTDTVPLGVFLLTDPQPEPTEPVTWTVAGFDQLYLLDQRLTAPVSYPTGQPVLDAVRQVLTLRGVFTDRIDNSRGADTLTEPRVWTIEFDGTYLDVVNDLLAMIGYEQLSMTGDGDAVSSPKIPADQRPVAWRYDAQAATSIVDDDGRAYETRNTDAPNYWLFWRSDVERDDPPSIGDGLYARQNDGLGPSSIDARGGLIIRSSNDGPIEASSQADLEANADAIVANEIQAAAVYRFTTDANPYHEHLDVVECVDRTFGVAGRFRHTSWELNVSERIMTHEVTSIVGGIV